MRPSPPGPDLDADLSVILDSAENIGPRVAIWQTETGPRSAHARRAAADAITAADDLLAATYRVRARLITETRRADDELLARPRDGGGP
jgi:hypothetical protein